MVDPVVPEDGGAVNKRFAMQRSIGHKTGLQPIRIPETTELFKGKLRAEREENAIQQLTC